MKARISIVTVMVLFAFFILLPAGSATADTQKIKFGHVAPPFHGQSKGADAFAAYVKDKTGGKIDIATFPMGQLGNERSMAEQVQAGTLHMAAITSAVLQNFVPQMAILDMPFIYPDRKTAYATLDDPEVQERLFSYFAKKGFVGIGFTENEFRDITNSKRPIRTPADVAGLKIRVMNSPVYLDTFKQLGASSVGIPFPEVYNALQTGVIDAQENPVLTSVLMKFTEVTKYATVTNHCLTECPIIVNPDYWASLSGKEKDIFRQAAKVCIKTNRDVNAAIHNKLPKLNVSIDEHCRKNGIELIRLSPEQRAVFRNATAPVWDKYRKKIGDEIFDFFLAKIKEHQK